MTYSVQARPDGTTLLRVDFSDEGVPLKGEITVRGGETEALAYCPIFESDLRRNFASVYPALLPQVEMIPPPEEGMIP